MWFSRPPPPLGGWWAKPRQSVHRLLLACTLPRRSNACESTGQEVRRVKCVHGSPDDVMTRCS